MAKITKYLITGGAGFIGSNFVQYLYRKHKNIRVCVLDKMGYSANIKNLPVSYTHLTLPTNREV